MQTETNKQRLTQDHNMATNLWTPFASLIHHESASRGKENTPEKQQRFQREISAMRERWGEVLDNDPAYNPNLTFEKEDWSLAWPPREEKLKLKV